MQYTPSNPAVSSSRSLRVSVRAFLARTGLVAALGASAYLGLGALSGAAAPTVQSAPSHSQMMDDPTPSVRCSALPAPC